MRAPFIRVVPDEVERYGAAPAVVLAHVRYRCASDGPGRIVVGGVRWWRASHGEIGREVGLSSSAVRRALERLANTVEVAHHEPLDDQRRSYKTAVELPQYESDTPASCHDTNPAPTPSNPAPTASNSTRDRVEFDDCTTYRDLGEVREEEGEAPIVDAELVDKPARLPEQIGQQQHTALPDLSSIPPEPPPYCPKHMPDGTNDSCGRCGDFRRNYARWEKRYGAAWDALHPPLMGKATANAVATLEASRRLTAEQTDAVEEPRQHPTPRHHCSRCLDGGIVLNSDGSYGRTIRICHHDNSWHEATDDELAELAALVESAEHSQ